MNLAPPNKTMGLKSDLFTEQKCIKTTDQYTQTLIACISVETQTNIEGNREGDESNHSNDDEEEQKTLCEEYKKGRDKTDDKDPMGPNEKSVEHKLESFVVPHLVPSRYQNDTMRGESQQPSMVRTGGDKGDEKARSNISYTVEGPDGTERMEANGCGIQEHSLRTVVTLEDLRPNKDSIHTIDQQSLVSGDSSWTRVNWRRELMSFELLQ